MVKGKCLHTGCTLQFDDADCIEDAARKLATHYRLEHPTKAFREDRVLSDLEQFNLTLDEAMEAWVGHNWRQRLANGALTSRNIIGGVREMIYGYSRYNEDVIQEARALALEHGTEIPDPYVNGDGNDNNGNIGGDIDGFIAAPAPVFIPPDGLN